MEPRVHPNGPRLDGGLPLRDAWVWALTCCVDRAIALAGASAGDLRTAVHDQRRALRCGRAIARLARPVLQTPDRVEVLAPLAAAMRATTELRDLAVVTDLLETRPADDPMSLALRQLLAHERDPYSEPAGVLAVLRSAASGVEDVPERFLAALPATVDWLHVERGLRASYRRSRRALRACLRAPGDDSAVHELRKRVKELRDQTGLFGEGEVGTLGRPHRALAELARALGEVTDGLALLAFVRARMSQLPSEHAEVLLVELHGMAGRRRAKAVRAGRDVLGGRPREVSSRWLDRIVP